MRLLSEDGKQLGVLSRDEALEYALAQGVDLVLINETSTPAVAKVTDYKKFLYQLDKKEREAKKSQKKVELKTIRQGPLSGDDYYQSRLKLARKFLEEGNPLKVVVKFVGRQMAHPEFGHKVIARYATDLADIAKISKEPKFEGKLLTATFAPTKS